MRFAKIIPASILILLVPAVVYAANAQDVLRRAQTADKRLTYKGIKLTTIHFADEVVTSKLKVIHLKPDMTRTEYFSPAAIAGMVVLQDGIDFWKYRPREDVWERMCPKVIFNENECSGFLKHFDLKINGVEEIAGRPAYVVYAVPKEGVESAHRVWVDKEHYMVIGTQSENPNGTVLNSSRYISIQVNPKDISPNLFRVTGRVTKLSQPHCVECKILKPTYLPAGYKLTGIMSMMVNGLSCVHLQFSNGVNSISLFEHKKEKRKSSPPIKSKVINVLNWDRGDMSFTLMSDISIFELRKIAKSIR